jgi:hypothetical protein
LVFWNLGTAIAARMPMMTTTMSSSMSVKPRRLDQGIVYLTGKAFGARRAWTIAPPCGRRFVEKAMPGP